MKIHNVFMYGLLALGIGAHAAEAKLTKKEASKRIAQAVEIFWPLAETGVNEYKVKPTKSVHDALLELAKTENYIDEDSEFSWVGSGAEAWEGDSTNWGEATMKDAYAYITELDGDREEALNEEGNEAEKAEVLKQIAEAKDAFKLLLKTGVKFGVVPLGAVQCGFTFAALAIIDPNTGKIWVFAKEGSGC